MTQIKIGFWTLTLAFAAMFVYYAIARDLIVGLFGITVLFSVVMIARGVCKEVQQ